MAYIFTTLNSFQGVMIFLTVCIFNQKVRNTTLKELQRSYVRISNQSFIHLVKCQFLNHFFYHQYSSIKLCKLIISCRPINECSTPSRTMEVVRKRAKPLLNNLSELFSGITLSIVVILVTRVATRV